jgi:hypothetical protein
VISKDDAFSQQEGLLFGSTGIWTQGLTLARQALKHSSSPVFVLDIFKIVFVNYLPELWTSILLISAS